MSKRKKLLIVGAIPPPLGGVSIHLERVLKWLSKQSYKYDFCSTKDGYIINVITASFRNQVVHLHISNSKIRLFLVFVLRFLLFKKVIFTVHGKIGKHKGFVDYNLDMLAIKFVSIPILLNEATFELAKKINQNSVSFTPFINPSNFEVGITNETAKNLDVFLEGIKDGKVFCTNASSRAFDQTGNEIYGISLLLKAFSQIEPTFGLIISDPTGENYDEAKKNNAIPKNVFFITELHNFSGIIKKSNCFIRATTTDGDPLSVKESLILETPVIASDCIERPDTVITFRSKDINSLKATILDFQPFKPQVEVKSGLKDLDKLYNSIL